MEIVKKLIIILSLFVILMTAVSCSEYSAHSGKAYIISIGIDYKYCSLPHLTCCPNDAQDISSALENIYTKKGIDCSLISMICEGENPSVDDLSYPSASKILAAIENINPDKNDTIVFYYSGHGVIKDNVSYFCAADESKTSYTNLEVNDVITALEAKNCPCTVIIDACYCGSDYAQGKESGFVDSIMSLVNKVEFSKIAVLASSSNQEESSGSLFGNSIFTSAVLTALKNSESSMTAQDLLNKVLKNNSFSNQTPEVNFNQANVYLIPGKTIIF